MSGKYQAYPEYKDTGIDWLSAVPVDWQVLPLKFASANKVKDGPHETPQFLDEGVPFFSVDGIQNCKLVFEGCRYISREDHERFSTKCLPKFGDVLLGKAASVGKVAFVDTKEDFNVWSPLAVLTPKSVKLGRFIFYNLQSTWLQAQCDVNSNSNTQKNLSMGVIDNLSFAIPSEDVAEKIANFLDHETAKIDTLIEKQQQLIKLLKEKRQAVISHAVTKGLNPNAPMRNSGVEWLGEVPEHWDVVPIKHLVSTPVTDGPHETPKFYDNGVPFISAEAVSSGWIDFSKIRAHISEEDNQRYSLKYFPEKYDIYMVKSGATTGMTAIVETDERFNIWSPLAVIRCKENSHPYFVLNFMRSFNFQEAVKLNWSFGTQQNIGMGVIENLHVTLPPFSEAKVIAKRLSEQCDIYDSIIDKALKQIGLMKECRTALISAAVTGKIDVRSWQAPEPSNINNKEAAA